MAIGAVHLLSPNTKNKIIPLLSLNLQNYLVKKFRKQSGDETQVLHTFRELVLGAYLEKNGFNVRHDFKIEGKTPDWVVLENDGSVECIIELVNFHIDKKTEGSIKQAFTDHNVWCDWVEPNNGRLCQRLQEKSDRYQTIAEGNHLPYVVAVYGEFMAGIEQDEIHEVLFHDYEGGLFNRCPSLSGVIFYEELGGRYSFKFFPNPNPSVPYFVKDGWL